MTMTPFKLKFPPETKFRCTICGEEHTFEDFDRNGAVAVFVGKDGLRPVCVCSSERCMGTITVLGGVVRQRTVGRIPTFSVTPSNDGKYVNLAIGDMGMTLASGPFINMFTDIGTRIIPTLRPEKGSVKMPPIPNIPHSMRSAILDSIGGEKPTMEIDLDTCPCCRFRDLYTFEDGPNDVTVQCNVCGRYGHGKTKMDAMTDLASKMEVKS